MALDTVSKHADVAGSGEHFSRYVGDNEGEVAPNYTYKKSEGRAKALEGQQVANDTLQNEVFSENVKQFEDSSLQNDMNPSQVAENNVKYNQENIDESTRTDNNNIQGREGSRTEAPNDGLHGTRPSKSDEGIQPFIRRSESSSSNAGSIIHDPSPEFKVELEAQGKPVNSYKELAANSDEDAASFITK